MVQGSSTRLHPSSDTNFLESSEGATSLLSHGCNLLGGGVGLHEGPSVNHSLVFVMLMNGTSSGRWMYCFFKLARERLMYLAGTKTPTKRMAAHAAKTVELAPFWEPMWTVGVQPSAGFF